MSYNIGGLKMGLMKGVSDYPEVSFVPTEAGQIRKKKCLVFIRE